MADCAIGVWLSITALARSEGTVVGVRHAVTACGKAAGAGAVLSMSASGGSHEPVFATDRRSDQLEDLQAMLGQGPSADVIGGAGLVLEAELAGAGALARWPQFASAAMARGVAAVFAIPVGVGAARVGVLGLYRDRPGALSREQFDAVLLYADAVLMLALDQRGGLAPGAADLLEPGFTERRAEIHQAAGMVSVQLGEDGRSQERDRVSDWTCAQVPGRCLPFHWSRQRAAGIPRSRRDGRFPSPDGST